MTVTPLGGPDGAPFPLLDVPDAVSRPTVSASGDAAASGFASALAHAVGATSEALGRADAAERAFAAGRGGLQEMTLERARADVALAVAASTASHVAQALQTILGMAV